MDKKTKLFNKHYLGEEKNSRRFIMGVLLVFTLIISATLSSGSNVVLSVEKNVNQTYAEIGSKVKYTIAIENDGGANLLGTQIMDILPPGFEYYSMGNSTPVDIYQYTTGGDNYLIINYSGAGGLIVGAGSSMWITITATVRSNASKGANVNKVIVNGSSSHDGALYIETDEATVIVKKAELLIVKETLNYTTYPGEEIRYKITVKNVGTGKAENIKVIDDLPSNWVYNGTTSGCISQNIEGVTDTVTFNLTDLNGSDAYTGSTCEFIYSVFIPYPQNLGPYINKAIVTGYDTDGVKLTNMTVTEGVWVSEGSAELVVNKEIENYREFEPGDVINFSIAVSNRGYPGSQLYNVTIVDFLPIGLNYSYSSPTPINISGDYTTGTNITWLFSNISGKTYKYIYLNATVMSNAPDGTNLNKAEGNGTKMDGTVVQFKDVAAAIVKRPKIEITKRSNISVGYVEPGSVVEFTIKVKNPGTGILYNVLVYDEMDPGWNFTTETNGECTPSGGGNEITFDCGNINRAQTKTIIYTAYVNNSVVKGTNLNKVNATGYDVTGTEYKANDTISLMVYKPKLEIVKSASIYDVEPGSSVVFTITVENPTYATAYDVNVTDILPVGFEYINGTSMLDGKVISGSAAPSVYDENNIQQDVTWIFGIIPPKTIKILTFETHVRCNVTNGTFTNNATTKGENGDEGPIENSTYIGMTGWKATATIAKSVDDQTPTYYQFLKYTVVIRNRLNVEEYEGANVLPLVITDVLPKGLRFVDGSAKLGGAGEIPLDDIQNITGSYTSPTGTTVKWNFTEDAILLEPGEFAVITYTAQVMPEIGSQASNTVTMTYLDPVPSGIEYCTDCEFSTGDINTIYPEITGVGDETTYTIPLDEGWNLISIPLAPVNVSIDSVFKSIEGKYTKAFAYESGWKYVEYVDGDKSGNLDKIEAGKGYWLYMLEAADLEITGNEILSAEVNLSDGWSLIGWLSDDQTGISEALASIDGDYDKVFTYDAGSGWNYRARCDDGAWNGNLAHMEPGKGYWIYMSTADTLVVN